MTNKTRIIVEIIIMAVAFSTGRWLAPEKIKTEIKTVEVEKKTDDKQEDKQDHKKVTIIETTKPDGTKTKTTTITDDRDDKSDDKSTDNTTTTTDKTKEVTRGSSPLTISFMAGMGIPAPATPIYGLSITRPVLGPVTLGLFGMTNRTGGVSVGLTF
jgi:hypothetical protein